MSNDKSKPQPAIGQVVARIVRCPQCGKSSEFSPRNSFRPFCSERCKVGDLGAWAEGRYAVPVENQNGDQTGDQTGSPDDIDHDDSENAED